MDDKKSMMNSVIFINKPIEKNDEDVIGFETQVDTICTAVKEGSSMIGIISDYGSGKSSLTQMLEKKITKCPYRYPKLFKINMWDCFDTSAKKSEIQTGNSDKNQTSQSSKEEVSELTKSFLFQLSTCKKNSKRFSSYINKRLSKNYGNLSFAVNSKSVWLWGALAAIFYSLYAVFIREDIDFGIIASSETILKVFNYCVGFCPVFLTIAIVLAIIGIGNACIVFSHWKTQNARATEINDVFDVYQDIIQYIKPRKRKKQIIVVEDLDRISDKAVIIGFIRELYRFQNVMKKKKNRFTFIVAVKPDCLLSNETHDLNSDDKNIYSKLFDIIITLKPIHYDDYDSIIIELLNTDLKKKETMESLLGYKITDETIIHDFYWIKAGENLTLRIIKDRLTRAIVVMSSLRNQNYKVKTAISFESCAAVTYLEYSYPDEYYNLISQEHSFAALMKYSVTLINEHPTDKKYVKKELTSFIKENFVKNDNCVIANTAFIDDLVEMIYNGVFNYDFRMYFYTYPKGSHIKTTEERELCEMLLLPNVYPGLEDLDKTVDTVYSSGDDNIVTNTIRSLHSLPFCVVCNETLLRIAFEVSYEATVNAVKEYIVIPQENGEFAFDFWNRVHSISFKKKLIFLNSICKEILLHFSEPEELISFRHCILRAFKKDITVFSELFVRKNNSTVPQITPEEIFDLADIFVAIDLVDTSNLNEENLSYISNLVCLKELKKIYPKSYEKAIEILNTYTKIIPKKVPTILLDFLTINKTINESYFRIIADNCTQKEIGKYINTLEIADIPDVYYEILDSIGISEELSNAILKQLIFRKKYICLLLTCSQKNDYSYFKNQWINLKGIVDACQNIEKKDTEKFIKIRKNICIDLNQTQYYKYLYSDIYPLITEEEFCQIDSTMQAIELICVARINEDNYLNLLKAIKKRNFVSNEVVRLFEKIFGSNGIDDDELYCDVIEDFPFEYMHLNSLSMDEREELYEYVDEAFTALSLSNIDRLTKLGCLVPSVEKRIDDDKDYISLLTELDEFTPYSIERISKIYIHCSLSKHLSDLLFANEDYENYITGSVLRTKFMIIDNRIPFDNYVRVYVNVPEMFDIMSNHWDFLESLQHKVILNELSESENPEHLLEPIFKVKQHKDLFNIVFSDKFDDVLKMKYLNSFGKFFSLDDSKAFAKLITLPENLRLVDKKLYKRVKEQLWEDDPYHKGVFTRKWKAFNQNQ